MCNEVTFGSVDIVLSQKKQGYHCCNGSLFSFSTCSSQLVSCKVASLKDLNQFLY